MYTYIVYYYSLIFQNKKGDLQKVSHLFGADEGTWTPTSVTLDPKSSASANSATSANNIIHYSSEKLICQYFFIKKLNFFILSTYYAFYQR